MHAYWDTSAVVALIYEEEHSVAAQRASVATRAIYMWEWGRVEAEAALLRRGAEKQDWRYLDEIFSAITWISTDRKFLDAVRRSNQDWKLRTMDAAHLEVTRRLVESISELVLVSFDVEMVTAAKQLGVVVFSGGSVKEGG